MCKVTGLDGSERVGTDQTGRTGPDGSNGPGRVKRTGNGQTDERTNELRGHLFGAVSWQSAAAVSCSQLAVSWQSAGSQLAVSWQRRATGVVAVHSLYHELKCMVGKLNQFTSLA